MDFAEQASGGNVLQHQHPSELLAHVTNFAGMVTTIIKAKVKKFIRHTKGGIQKKKHLFYPHFVDKRLTPPLGCVKYAKTKF